MEVNFTADLAYFLPKDVLLKFYTVELNFTADSVYFFTKKYAVKVLYSGAEFYSKFLPIFYQKVWCCSFIYHSWPAFDLPTPKVKIVDTPQCKRIYV